MKFVNWSLITRHEAEFVIFLVEPLERGDPSYDKDRGLLDCRNNTCPSVGCLLVKSAATRAVHFTRRVKLQYKLCGSSLQQIKTENSLQN